MILDSDQLAAIVAHARRCYPAEACGLIAGSHGRVASVYPIQNVERDARRYRMEAGQQRQAMERMSAQGQQLLALYHSHPRTRAYPSRRDIALACFADCEYLIVSLQTPEEPVVRAFRIAGGEVAAERLVVVPPAPPAAGPSLWRRLLSWAAPSAPRPNDELLPQAGGEKI